MTFSSFLLVFLDVFLWQHKGENFAPLLPAWVATQRFCRKEKLECKLWGENVCSDTSFACSLDVDTYHQNLTCIFLRKQPSRQEKCTEEAACDVVRLAAQEADKIWLPEKKIAPPPRKKKKNNNKKPTHKTNWITGRRTTISLSLYVKMCPFFTNVYSTGLKMDK